MKSDLHRLNLSFARWEKQLTDEKDELNAKKKERLKILEEMLYKLEEKLRRNLEDTEDLKTREEQLELLIGKHHETLIAHNRRMNSLKPQAQPIPTPNIPEFRPTTGTKLSVVPDMEVKIAEEHDNNKTSGSNETKTNENDSISTDNISMVVTTEKSVQITESIDQTTGPSLQVTAEDTESHNDGGVGASEDENLDTEVLEVDGVSEVLLASTEPSLKLNSGMNTTVTEIKTIQGSSLKSNMSNALVESFEMDLEDDARDDSKDDLSQGEEVEEDREEDLEEYREEDREEGPEEKDPTEDPDEDPANNKDYVDDQKEADTENQDGSLEGSEEQSV